MTSYEPGGPPTRTETSGRIGRESTGLGDVGLRLKRRVLAHPNRQVAITGEVRFPTGDPDHLRGTGHVSVKGAIIAALVSRAFSPHVNVGYVYAGSGIEVGQPTRPPGKGPVRFGPLPNTYLKPNNYEQLFADITVEPSDEVLFTAGFDSAIPFTETSGTGNAGAAPPGPSSNRKGQPAAGSPRATIAVDFIGRTLRNSARLEKVPFTQPMLDGGERGGASILQPFLRPRNVTLLLGVFGVKYRIGNDWLATANVVVPLSYYGLRPGITPVIGVERAM